jgi:hypothetical protein
MFGYQMFISITTNQKAGLTIWDYSEFLAIQESSALCGKIGM